MTWLLSELLFYLHLCLGIYLVMISWHIFDHQWRAFHWPTIFFIILPELRLNGNNGTSVMWWNFAVMKVLTTKTWRQMHKQSIQGRAIKHVLVKYRSGEMCVESFLIALELDKHLGNNTYCWSLYNTDKSTLVQFDAVGQHAIIVTNVDKIQLESPYEFTRHNVLTQWGRMTHICVSKLTIIGSDNGLSPGRCQAIIWTNAGLLLIRPLGTNFSVRKTVFNAI